ncbi:hypothetical protein [Yersinia ruckeri]|uniref:hypothetical protein n=1 Tax=Yersinia ruckeri TaxID=29486 RepID=UPI0020BD55AD|nr:hypothetical protein [Yersinia ruckeri]MCK8542090.1 hypothetical protein [Yersinia ruckeri]MCK8553162.1 hypothetical protein [Yersinia ruckeri]MCW6519483.1 hypothetical protein [Yersinia ruckeri]MCW6551160.1 hypothetical protein [Yersinia ruckeri]MCW6576878.1 hypothetical protein [Yersinia ruckeri]
MAAKWQQSGSKTFSCSHSFLYSDVKKPTRVGYFENKLSKILNQIGRHPSAPAETDRGVGLQCYYGWGGTGFYRLIAVW